MSEKRKSCATDHDSFIKLISPKSKTIHTFLNTSIFSVRINIQSLYKTLLVVALPCHAKVEEVLYLTTTDYRQRPLFCPFKNQAEDVKEKSRNKKRTRKITTFTFPSYKNSLIQSLKKQTTLTLAKCKHRRHATATASRLIKNRLRLYK